MTAVEKSRFRTGQILRTILLEIDKNGEIDQERSKDEDISQEASWFRVERLNRFLSDQCST